MNTVFFSNPIALLLRRGWLYAGQYKPSMLLYMLLFVAAQASMAFEPYLIGKMLNILQEGAMNATKSGAQTWGEVGNCLWLWFGIQFLFWLFHGPGRVIERYVAFHIGANYKKHLFGLVTELPLKWHRQHHSGESIDKINRATNALTNFYDSSFELSYMIFRMVSSLAALFWFMPFAGWIALGATVVACANVFLFDRYLSRQYDELNGMGNKVAAAVHDYVSNIVSVITLRVEGRVVGEVDRRMHAPLQLFTKNIKLNEVKWFFVTALITVMTMVVLFHYANGELKAGHVILGGTFFTLFEYLRRIGDSFYDFASLYGTVVKQASDVKSADTIINGMVGVEVDSTESLPVHWQNISVTGVNFRYEDEQHREHHLLDVSVNLQRGRSVAFVGESGSGKSTFLSLLRGLQEADGALVTVDGHQLPGKLRHLATHTTLIPQDPEIFSDTIRFNVTFGLEASDDTVMRAIEAARFDAVLSRLPRGLETSIAEKGINLSGGEKQRLALARGLFFAKDSDIVLLDEPTSSVDTVNERWIYQNILAECKDKCVVSSIHKLHLLELFDDVYVFSNGQLVESGSFTELRQQGGVLANLWRNYQTSSEVPTLQLVV